MKQIVRWMCMAAVSAAAISCGAGEIEEPKAEPQTSGRRCHRMGSRTGSSVLYTEHQWCRSGKDRRKHNGPFCIRCRRIFRKG